MKAFVLLLLLLPLPCRVVAHPADVTPVRVAVERQKLEFRFTFSLYTLARMIPEQAQGEGRPSKSALEKMRPDLATYLQEHVKLKINEHEARLGALEKVEALWPENQGTAENDTDLSIDAFFALPWPGVIENAWIEFTGFSDLGELATLQVTFEQGELRMHVPLSSYEPDYFYDTGFGVEEIFASLPEEALSQSGIAWEGKAVGWVNVLLTLIVLSPLLYIFRKTRKGGEGGAP